MCPQCQVTASRITLRVYSAALYPTEWGQNRRQARFYNLFNSFCSVKPNSTCRLSCLLHGAVLLSGCQFPILATRNLAEHAPSPPPACTASGSRIAVHCAAAHPVHCHLPRRRQCHLPCTSPRRCPPCPCCGGWLGPWGGPSAAPRLAVLADRSWPPPPPPPPDTLATLPERWCPIRCPAPPPCGCREHIAQGQRLWSLTTIPSCVCTRRYFRPQ